MGGTVALTIRTSETECYRGSCWTAEARDQAREAAPPANRRIQLNRRKAATRRR